MSNRDRLVWLCVPLLVASAAAAGDRLAAVQNYETQMSERVSEAAMSTASGIVSEALARQQRSLEEGVAARFAGIAETRASQLLASRLTRIPGPPAPAASPARVLPARRATVLAEAPSQVGSRAASTATAARPLADQEPFGG